MRLRPRARPLNLKICSHLLTLLSLRAFCDNIANCVCTGEEKGERMRILHTADWHLGDRLGRIDRTDDLRKAVERVAAYCESEKADVLLVAGDLFSELASPDALRDSISHLRKTFESFLRGGGTILALTGN